MRRWRGCGVRIEFARLREIKKKYDPDNFFRHNVNILPK
jgi:FAD/FMN-containing dehydrogenase